MRLSRFNAAGIAAFSSLLDSVRASGSGGPGVDLLTSNEFTETVSTSVEVPEIVFISRMHAARYVDGLLSRVALPDAERDSGLWAWLAARHFSSLCRATGSGGSLKPGERARWIPEPANFQRYYRHLLAGPYLIFRAHKDDPDRALVLLCGAPAAPGEVAEQIASRIEMVSNAALVSLATRLYYDPTTQSIKRGAGGKGPGSARRLADIVNQLDLTWDLYGMTVEQLVAILPAEFRRFLAKA